MSYQTLLEAYKVFQRHNKQQIDAGVHDYSLINALLKKNDEVHLHSNFIFSMIDPDSNHYCGDIFLKLFLHAIGEEDFIDYTVARVHKEKDKIDLLIEDGERVLIIENKLRAKDQHQQIVRYLYRVIESYFNDDRTNLQERVHIVYLSEYKAKPSIASKSLEGFLLEKGNLIWQNSSVELSSDKILSLPENTMIPFKRVRHSKELDNWCAKAGKWIEENRPDNAYRASLVFAFEEYRTILKRLDETRRKEWRNIMSLDEYTLNLESQKQQDMYAFMCEANQKLYEYLGKKLYREIDSLIPAEKRERYVNQNGTEFKVFDEKKCIDWFKQKKNKKSYKDIGFRFDMGEDRYFFAMGVDNIAIGKIEDDWKSSVKTNRSNIVKNKKDKNLFYIIAVIKDLLKQN